MSVRRVVAAVLTLAVAVGATACGDEQPVPLPRETAANGTVFNSADATFARALLVQRAREFALIDLTIGRPLDADLTAFVDDARTTRAGEIEQVTTWLTDWGKEVPPTIRDHAAAHEGAHHFAALEQTDDGEFAAAWILAYQAELEESREIAAAEEKRGAFGAARALAADVTRANKRESAHLAEYAR